MGEQKYGFADWFVQQWHPVISQIQDKLESMTLSQALPLYTYPEHLPHLTKDRTDEFTVIDRGVNQWGEYGALVRAIRHNEDFFLRLAAEDESGQYFADNRLILCADGRLLQFD